MWQRFGTVVYRLTPVPITCAPDSLSMYRHVDTWRVMVSQMAVRVRVRVRVGVRVKVRVRDGVRVRVRVRVRVEVRFFFSVDPGIELGLTVVRLRGGTARPTLPKR